MPKPVKAMVEKSLIRWARETSGYSIEDVASRIDKTPADIEKWERGIDRPYMGQLNKMADMFGRPISDFFLPAPPKERPLPHDFRRSSGSQPESYSPDLRKQLRFAQERHDLALTLLEELGNDINDFKHRASRKKSPEKVGEEMRKLLRVCFDEQKSWKSGYHAFNMWRKLIERQDILVFQFENVAVEEAWGFSIYEARFPVVGINKKLAPNGRTFTMLHEVAHLLLGQSRVCDLDDLTERGQSSSGIEAFCNRAAASALLPRDIFLSRAQETKNRNADCAWEEKNVTKLASCFGTSKEAVARRLLTFDLITVEHYRKYRASLKDRAEKKAAKLKKRQNKKSDRSGQPASQRAVSDYGTTFVSAVLGNLNQQRITLADASQYLHVRASAVSDVEKIIANGQSAA